MEKAYTDDMKKLVPIFLCVLSTPPSPRPVCAKSSHPETSQSNVSIDVVHFCTQLNFPCSENRFKWPKVGLLRSRRLEDQIDVFKCIKQYRHSIPERIIADQEHKKTWVQGVLRKNGNQADLHHCRPLWSQRDGKKSKLYSEEPFLEIAFGSPVSHTHWLCRWCYISKKPVRRT